jgi:hypothetical protein
VVALACSISLKMYILIIEPTGCFKNSLAALTEKLIFISGNGFQF